MRKLLYLSLILALSCSCDETTPPGRPQAVIEATFSSGGYPKVLFSSSVVPGEEGSLRDAVINWGKVTISDGEREVVMTGRPDPRYLPPYVYTTLDMTGEPGKEYTITARYGDLYAESRCRMPRPTPIDSIVLSPAGADTLRAATLFFTSPEDVPAYYYLSMSRPGVKVREAPCMMGTIRADLPGRSYSLALLRPRVKIDSVKYQSQLIVGEEWDVSLNRVEAPVYEFWRAYDNMVLFSSSPFLNSDQSLPGNIEGGYGIWSPQGSSTLRFTVE